MRQYEYQPCIPTRGTEVPSGPDWFHELKHDGYRLIVQREGKRVRTISHVVSDFVSGNKALERRIAGAGILHQLVAAAQVHHAARWMMKPVPELTSNVGIQLNKRVSLRLYEAAISLNGRALIWPNSPHPPAKLLTTRGRRVPHRPAAPPFSRDWERLCNSASPTSSCHSLCLSWRRSGFGSI